LALEIVEGRDISDADFVAARGIVLCLRGPDAERGAGTAELTARKAMDHGLQILVLASEDEIMRHAQNEMSRLRIAAHIHKRTGDAKAVPDHEIAQLMLMADAKMRWSPELQLSRRGDFELLEIDELLLRRPSRTAQASQFLFWEAEDCRNLHG
jgi:hypothetical protein